MDKVELPTGECVSALDNIYPRIMHLPRADGTLLLVEWVGIGGQIPADYDGRAEAENVVRSSLYVDAKGTFAHELLSEIDIVPVIDPTTGRATDFIACDEVGDDERFRAKTLDVYVTRSHVHFCGQSVGAVPKLEEFEDVAQGYVTRDAVVALGLSVKSPWRFEFAPKT